MSTDQERNQRNAPFTGGVKKYTYSVTEIADFYAENIRICDGNITFDFVGPEIRIPDVELGVPVKVNIGERGSGYGDRLVERSET